MNVKGRQFNHVFPLAPYFGEMIGDKKEVKIADVGAGMYSTTGSTWPGVTVDLYPSDILSDEFNAILKENNVTPVISVTKEDMLHLSYPDNFFDIVHCANALDHCVFPMDAIKEMYRVCKLGGYIHLRHFEDVGESQHYNGFHLWNLTEEDGRCVLWNPGHRFDLSDYFDFVSVKREHRPRQKLATLIVVTIQKFQTRDEAL